MSHARATNRSSWSYLERIDRPSGMTEDLRELARRRSGSLEVVLLWSPRASRVFVDVEDEVDGAVFRIVVDRANALDAFNHPYAYLEAA
jgi:hypothetical protein